MDNGRLPHILLHEYSHGSCIKERTQKKWIDNVWEDCVARNISLRQATELALDHSKCRSIVCQVGCWSARTTLLSPGHYVELQLRFNGVTN